MLERGRQDEARLFFCRLYRELKADDEFVDRLVEDLQGSKELESKSEIQTSQDVTYS